MNLFTYIPEIDINTLLYMSDQDLLSVRCVNQYSQNITNEYFWKQRFYNKYKTKLSSEQEYFAIYKSLLHIPDDCLWLYIMEIGNVMLFEAFEHLYDKANLLWGVRITALYGHLNLLEKLIERGPAYGGIYVDNNWIANLAASHGQLEVLKYLINKECYITDMDHVTHLCARKGYLHMFKYFVETGIEFDRNTAIKYSKLYGHVKLLKYLS